MISKFYKLEGYRGKWYYFLVSCHIFYIDVYFAGLHKYTQGAHNVCMRMYTSVCTHTIYKLTSDIKDEVPESGVSRNPDYNCTSRYPDMEDE